MFAAHDSNEERDVALKVLSFSGSPTDPTFQRFERERRIGQTLSHPSLVRVFDTGWAETGAPFIAMELLRGETLAARIERARLRVDELVPHIAPIADALEYVHAQDVVHRDVKPSNIFLCETAEEPRVVLLDFGVGLHHDDPRVTGSMGVVGTPAYLSPEQLRAERPVLPLVDIYSLGVVIYEALTGHTPFAGATFGDLGRAIQEGSPLPPSVHCGCSAELDATILKAMATSPGARYASAANLLLALRLAAVGDPSPQLGRRRFSDDEPTSLHHLPIHRRPESV